MLLSNNHVRFSLRFGLTSFLTLFAVLAIIAALAQTSEGPGQIQNLRIIHTSDMHSHLLGFSPNADYTPASVNDDVTLGGWARVATIIKQQSAFDGGVLVVDSGDFLMGSFFHTISRESAIELQLLQMMGYDALTLGNHEFDLKPQGLAEILQAAKKAQKLPNLLLANVEFSKEFSGDDQLSDAFAKGWVKPYIVLQKKGLKVGIFGLMGKNAAEVAPFAKPVRFLDPISTAQAIVRQLRDHERVDVVVCLSHSGLVYGDRHGSGVSEDEELARRVTGIDVIASGHTHTKLEQALKINNTLIVSSYEYGKQVGVLDLAVDTQAKTLRLIDQKSIEVNDRFLGDAGVTAMINTFIDQLNKGFLRQMGFTFWQPIAKTAFDLTISEQESNLGNLVADALLWYSNRYGWDGQDESTRIQAAVVSNGVIRDDILKGKTGLITAADAFRALPLGIGIDNSIGYPLVSMYITGQEIKKSLEVLTTIYPLKGSSYYIQISGLKFHYNPRRVMFDRVTAIYLQDKNGQYKPLDYSSSNKKMYRVAADIYNASFLKIVGRFTWGILEIIPKDSQGNTIDSLTSALIDKDPQREGVQEVKAWSALLEYLKGQDDIDGDGLADVPERYQEALGRIVVAASYNPWQLLRNGNLITWSVAGLLLAILFLIAWLGKKIWRRFSR